MLTDLSVAVFGRGALKHSISMVVASGFVFLPISCRSACFGATMPNTLGMAMTLRFDSVTNRSDQQRAKDFYTRRVVR